MPRELRGLLSKMPAALEEIFLRAYSGSRRRDLGNLDLNGLAPTIPPPPHHISGGKAIAYSGSQS